MKTKTLNRETKISILEAIKRGYFLLAEVQALETSHLQMSVPIESWLQVRWGHTPHPPHTSRPNTYPINRDTAIMLLKALRRGYFDESDNNTFRREFSDPFFARFFVEI